MQFPKDWTTPDRVPCEFGFARATTPVHRFILFAHVLSVWVGGKHYPGQPWLLLRGAISCYVLAFAPNHHHRHPSHLIDLLGTAGRLHRSLLYISIQDRGRGGDQNPLFIPFWNATWQQGSRLNWVQVLRLECGSTRSCILLNSLLHISNFDILIRIFFLKSFRQEILAAGVHPPTGFYPSPFFNRKYLQREVANYKREVLQQEGLSKSCHCQNWLDWHTAVHW